MLVGLPPCQVCGGESATLPVPAALTAQSVRGPLTFFHVYQEEGTDVWIPIILNCFYDRFRWLFLFNTVNSAFSQCLSVPDELMLNSLASDHVSVCRYRTMWCESPDFPRVGDSGCSVVLMCCCSQSVPRAWRVVGWLVCESGGGRTGLPRALVPSSARGICGSRATSRSSWRSDQLLLLLLFKKTNLFSLKE